jgi:predicted Zn-dependent peptidase
MLALILLAGLLAGDTVPTFSIAAPLSTSPPDRGAGEGPARIIVHRQPQLPLVALRLSILMNDPPGYSGAGHLVQHLQLARMQEAAAVVGARVQIARNSDALVYSVMGPASELAQLASVLRLALVVPQVVESEFLTAMHELYEERLAEWETAERHVRATLRSQVFPNDLPAAGTEQAAARLTRARLNDLWSHLYRPDRTSLVAVGNVTAEAVRSAFGELPAPRAGPRLPPLAETVPVRPLAPPEATSAWFGAAWPVWNADPGAVAVTGRLLQRWLAARLDATSVVVEHWWTHEGQALVAVVSTTEAQRRNARSVLADPLSAMQRELDAAAVRAAATGLRREMVFYARTPDRFAELLGSFADREAGVEAQAFYDELERARLGDVLLALDELLKADPVRVEVAPQRVQGGR